MILISNYLVKKLVEAEIRSIRSNEEAEEIVLGQRLELDDQLRELLQKSTPYNPWSTHQPIKNVKSMSMFYLV